jgi:hypothetical protein
MICTHRWKGVNLCHHNALIQNILLSEYCKENLMKKKQNFVSLVRAASPIVNKEHSAPNEERKKNVSLHLRKFTNSPSSLQLSSLMTLFKAVKLRQ